LHYRKNRINSISTTENAGNVIYLNEKTKPKKTQLKTNKLCSIPTTQNRKIKRTRINGQTVWKDESKSEKRKAKNTCCMCLLSIRLHTLSEILTLWWEEAHLSLTAGEAGRHQSAFALSEIFIYRTLRFN